MVMQELCLIARVKSPDRLTRAKLPAGGPIIVCERTNLPYQSHNFRYYWRSAATAAGIPKTVLNGDSQMSGADTRIRAGSFTGNSSAPDDQGSKIREQVHAALPTSLPDHIRSDVAHDLIVDSSRRKTDRGRFVEMGIKIYPEALQGLQQPLRYSVPRSVFARN
jgi:hypothetical protein